MTCELGTDSDITQMQMQDLGSPPDEVMGEMPEGFVS
jgi:hypothetical protein